MIKPRLIVINILLCILLIGCAKSILDNDEARCPFFDRGGCQSMEMVNRMVSENRFTPDGEFVQQNARSMPYKQGKLL